MTNLRFGDLYRNVARYLKKNECSHDFKGTRQWLARLTSNQAKIDTVIVKIRSAGASCDHEILTEVKGQVYGRTLLVVIDGTRF